MWRPEEDVWQRIMYTPVNHHVKSLRLNNPIPFVFVGDHLDSVDEGVFKLLKLVLSKCRWTFLSLSLD